MNASSPACADRSTGGWHYRRSLASRVTLLTTMARRPRRRRHGARRPSSPCAMQLQSTPRRVAARPRAQGGRRHRRLSRSPPTALPSWVLGAADVRIVFFTAEGRGGDRRRRARLHARRARSSRSRPGSASRALRTLVTDDGERLPGRRPCRPTTAHALVLAQSLDPQRPDAARSSAACCSSSAALGVLAAGARRLGGGPQRAAAGPPAHRRRSSTSPDRGPAAAARRGRRRDRPAGHARSTRC